MKMKAQIMDGAGIARAMTRMTHEIIERNGGVDNLCIFGVKSRGIPLAKMLSENIKKFEGVDMPYGVLDITVHRDDLSREEKENAATECLFPCDVQGKVVILVDDVLFTGRTARAAMESVFQKARPKAVQLAVLIDRGHRELPIRPDYVGKNVPTSHNERIQVALDAPPEECGVFLVDLEEN